LIELGLQIESGAAGARHSPEEIAIVLQAELRCAKEGQT
jgi:hypothetical protein